MAGQTIAAAYVAIMPSFKGGAAAIGREMDGPLGVAGTAGGKAYGGGMRTGIAGMAKSVFAPLLAVGAGIMAGKFFSGAIKEASGLNESINALNVSYGGASQGVQALGKAAATNLGLSNLEFNNLAVRFSSFSKTIAGDGGDVTKTLGDLTGRASDFASVMNLDVNEAAQLFQSGLAGESEPLRKFGIDMSAASVEAFGLANGLAANGKSLTESEKIQARYGYLMEQTSATQGDFANTSDQLANKQRITAAEFDNVKARIGTGLLPIMSALVGFVGDSLLPALDSMGSFITGTVVPAVKDFAGFITGTVVPGIRSFAKWVGDSAGTIKIVAGIITTLLLPVFISMAVGWAYSAAAAIASGTQTAAIWLMLQGDAIASAASQFASHYRVVAGWVASAAAAVASGAQTVAIWAMYKIEAVKGAASTVAAHAQMAAAWVASKVQAGISAAAAAAAWVASSAQTIAAFVAQTAAQIGSRAVMIASAAAIGIVTVAQWLWNAAMSANPIGLVVIAIAALVAAIVWVVLNFDKVKVAAAAAWDWIKNAWSGAGDFFAGIGDGIRNALKGAFNAVAGWWNNSIGKVGFTVPDWVPLVGGKSFDIPNIPLLAEGALVTNPALAMLGESGKEAVLPYSRVDEFAGMVARQLAGMNLGKPNGSRAAGNTFNIYEVVDPNGTALAVSRRLVSVGV